MVGIVGHMSGGKTYTAVSYMLDFLYSGHIVCSNIKLNCRGVSSYLSVPCVLWKQNYFLLSDSPSGYHEILTADYDSYPMGAPRGDSDYQQRMVYIFLDEISSVFDSITHSSNSEIKDVATWARHTEKRGQMIFLIMQFSSELHKRLRNHVTEYHTCVNSGNLRLPVLNVRLPPFLRHYIIRTFYAGDEETKISSSKWVPIEPRIYDCYFTSQIVYGSQIGTNYKPVVLDRSVSLDRRFWRVMLVWLLLSLVNILGCFLLSLWFF